jgi:hypothetical protein
MLLVKHPVVLWKLVIRLFFLAYSSLNLGKYSLYHLSHVSIPFLLLVVFWIGNSIFIWASLNHDSVYTCCIAGMTCVWHHSQLIGWDVVSLTVCLGWPQTVIFPIFTSQVARIIGMKWHTPLRQVFKCYIFYYTKPWSKNCRIHWLFYFNFASVWAVM